MTAREPGGWQRVTTVMLSAASALAVGLAGASLARPMFEDQAVMSYLGYLVDRVGLVPYRDFFDMNTPGAYVANVVVGRLADYTEAGARLVDLGWLAVLLAVTVALMRPFGRQSHVVCRGVHGGHLPVGRRAVDAAARSVAAAVPGRRVGAGRAFRRAAGRQGIFRRASSSARPRPSSPRPGCSRSPSWRCRGRACRAAGLPAPWPAAPSLRPRSPLSTCGSTTRSVRFSTSPCTIGRSTTPSPGNVRTRC